MPEMANGSPSGWDNADLDSELIKRIQEKLFVSATDVSGIYTIETRKAVEEFQRQNQLQVDGIPGPITLEAMGIDAGGVPRDIVRDREVEGDINIGSSNKHAYLAEESDLCDSDLPGDATTDPR